MDQVDKHDKRLRQYGYNGYAHYYLQELKTKADVAIYKQLLEIDAKLGTAQSEQLFECLDPGCVYLGKKFIEV